MSALLWRSPLFQHIQPAMTGHEGLLDDTIRGVMYESMGGSDPPRTQIALRATDTTGQANALQKHKALQRLADSAASKATNVLALRDPAATCKPEHTPNAWLGSGGMYRIVSRPLPWDLLPPPLRPPGK